jgi:hypothetical protein
MMQRDMRDKTLSREWIPPSAGLLLHSVTIKRSNEQ